MYQAATASSAAVPFFAPYTVWRNPEEPTRIDWPGEDFYPPMTGTGDSFELVDGGNGGLGTPALFATVEETDKSLGKAKTVLSIGTGHYTERVPTSSIGGFVQWIGDGGELLKCVFDGETDVTNRVLEQMEGPGLQYFRWQPDIPASLAFMDEGSVEDMNALEDITRTFIADNDEEIDTVVEILERITLFV